MNDFMNVEYLHSRELDELVFYELWKALKGEVIRSDSVHISIPESKIYTIEYRTISGVYQTVVTFQNNKPALVRIGQWNERDGIFRLKRRVASRSRLYYKNTNNEKELTE